MTPVELKQLMIAFPFILKWGFFPHSSAGKESACNARDLGSIPVLGRSPGEGKGYQLQYSGLENSMDYSPWDHKELNMTEPLSLSFFTFHSQKCPGFGQ